MRGWGMKKSFMERLAAFIVDKRRLFVVLFAVACVLSIFSASKTDVNNELTDYLPDSTQTRQGLEIMNREFITYGDAKVMVSNVTLAQAEELAEMLRGVDGVKDVEFEKDTHHYNTLDRSSAASDVYKRQVWTASRTWNLKRTHTIIIVPRRSLRSRLTARSSMRSAFRA